MKKISILLLAAFMIVSFGCNKFIEGYDVSPNNPSEVTPALMLSSVEVATFAIYTGGLNRNSSVFVQQIEGTDAQMNDVANYVLLEGDNVNEWNSIYTDIISEANELIAVTEEKNPYYSGIAKVLKAMTLGLATDLWGDIPSREAGLGINGAEFYSPNFDAQQVVIGDIQTLLDEAIALLSLGADANTMLPAADDHIFGGDVKAWVNTAWLLKARYAMRLSKKDQNAATTALGYLDKLNADAKDCMAVFGPNSNELNTWYAFSNARASYLRMGEFFVNHLQGINDPRLPFFAAPDVDGNYVGAAPNSMNIAASNIGAYYNSNLQPLPLVMLVEAKFIEAEAKFRNSDLGGAATALNDAIKQSVTQVTGAPDQTFFDAQASETGSSVTLQKIMMHKYIASFLQVESYNDWRRTGFPALVANPTATGNSGKIPVRFPTPQDERINNPNATVVTDINLPVWWAE